MYFDYIKERENLDHIKKDFGFLTYKMTEKECFLANVYIKPEHRRSDKFGLLIGEIADLAKSKGCELLTATVHLVDKGANRTIKAAQKLDFFIVEANNNIIILAKELGE